MCAQIILVCDLKKGRSSAFLSASVQIRGKNKRNSQLEHLQM